jgi:uncharacterized membrane protein
MLEPNCIHSQDAIMKTAWAHCKADFLTGLAVVLPPAVSIGVVIWLFNLVSNVTDGWLLLVPRGWRHAPDGAGTMPLLWSVLALALTLVSVGLVGRLARYYAAKRLIRLLDLGLMRVPLLNRIYRALKQINEAFMSDKTSTFKRVVLVEFPRAACYSIGFVTSTQNGEMRTKDHIPLLSVFVPAPPLTSGFIIMVPEADVVTLKMSVADGIKFIMSLGSVSPAWAARAEPLHEGATRGLQGTGLPDQSEAGGSLPGWIPTPKACAPSPVVAWTFIKAPCTKLP